MIAKRQLDEEAHELVRTSLDLANGLARRHFYLCREVMPLAELQGEARFALVYAALRYDQSMDVPFRAYATSVIRNHLGRAVQEWRHCGPLRLSLFTDLEEYAKRKTWVHVVDPACPWARESWQTLAVQEMVEQIKRHVTPLVYELMLLHYVDGITLKEIGKQRGVSKQRIRTILKNARKRLRKLLDLEECE
jgi:RNA polymerase sigma factor (sigma-70 family)